MEWFVKIFMAYCGGKGELYKFSCILEKMCYIPSLTVEKVKSARKPLFKV